MSVPAAWSALPERAPVRPRKPYTATKTREMWSPEEHARMLEGLRLYKRDWAAVTRCVRTRSPAQVRSHAQKYFDRVARDKTDEYVPVARAKRKSAVPYPRKARRDAEPAPEPAPQVLCPTGVVHHHPMPQQQAHVHMQVQHPQMQQMHQLQQMQQMQQMQQPVYVAHASPIHHMAMAPARPMPPPPPHHLYSPYMGMPSPVSAHPSPMSYMSTAPYTGNSPAAQSPMSLPHQGMPMYSVFSPMTPAAFASPSLSQGPHVPPMGTPPLGVTASHQQHPSHHPVPHIPAHSHPEHLAGNCPKCSALQRYGNVLYEMVDLGHASGQQPPPTPQQASVAPQQQQPATPELPAVSQHQQSQHQPHHLQQQSRPGQQQQTSCGPSSDDRTTPGLSGKSSGARLSSSSDGLDAAQHRARRAQVLKARKRRHAADQAPQRPSSSSEDSSRDGSRSPGMSSASGHALPAAKSHVAAKKSPSAERQAPKTGPKTVQIVCDQKTSTLDTDGAPAVNKKKRSLSKEPTSSNGSGARKRARVSLGHRSLSVGGQGGSCYDGGSSGSASDLDSSTSDEGCRSPNVETYTATEQKEIFDAVQSLQILAKNPSSPSSSPRAERGSSPAAVSVRESGEREERFGV